MAEIYGYTVINPLSVMVAHLSEVNFTECVGTAFKGQSNFSL